MVEMTLAATLLAASVTFGAGPEATPARAEAQQSAAAPSIAAADLAPFLGDWALTLSGPNGPATMALSIKTEKDKPAGELSSEAMPKQAISDFSMADKTLVMNYSFTWEGNPVSAVISLTPAADGPAKAQIDFAGGAYVMSGTAAKKDKDQHLR
jgi:hypothetical protein